MSVTRLTHAQPAFEVRLFTIAGTHWHGICLAGEPGLYLDAGTEHAYLFTSEAAARRAARFLLSWR